MCVCLREGEREALSGSCAVCMDDASNVSSLSRCCILCQVPQYNEGDVCVHVCLREGERERERKP